MPIRFSWFLAAPCRTPTSPSVLRTSRVSLVSNEQTVIWSCHHGARARRKSSAWRARVIWSRKFVYGCANRTMTQSSQSNASPTNTRLIDQQMIDNFDYDAIVNNSLFHYSFMSHFWNTFHKKQLNSLKNRKFDKFSSRTIVYGQCCWTLFNIAWLCCDNV